MKTSPFEKAIAISPNHFLCTLALLHKKLKRHKRCKLDGQANHSQHLHTTAVEHD